VLWLFIHLLYLVGFQNRVVVLIQWAFQYLTFNRGARLITGQNPPLPEMHLTEEMRERLEASH
jgi:NADH dehydrogenase